MGRPEEVKIAIIGLGYVGLPLAVEFGKTLPVVGFDVSLERISELQGGHDRTLEVDASDLGLATGLTFSSDEGAIRDCNVYIVTVPTPIDQNKRPDLRPLLRASEVVGRAINKGDIVIYESTVYPGATEEECVPILAQKSGLRFNEEFFVGYSPERINPGDKSHRLINIKKITSGSNQKAALFVDELYSKIITAGTFLAESIKVAEAAKVIENTQRDLNIALMNELAIIFDRLDIDTCAVLEAAGTKWNFLPFRPGLVGGHCIGVDPYYLTHKAEAVGYHPEIILAGRRLNDGMGAYVASQMIKAMLGAGLEVSRAKILIMGLTFKENCPDIRNSRVIDVLNELIQFGVEVDIHDPWVAPRDAKAELGLDLVAEPKAGVYDGIIVAVGHARFVEMGAEQIRDLGKPSHVLFDLKSIFKASASDLRL